MASSRACASLRSRRGSSSQRLSRRLPMPVMQVSSSENRVGESSPRSVCTSSRLRRVVGGSSISSPSRSHLQAAARATARGPACAPRNPAAPRRPHARWPATRRPRRPGCCCPAARSSLRSPRPAVELPGGAHREREGRAVARGLQALLEAGRDLGAVEQLARRDARDPGFQRRRPAHSARLQLGACVTLSQARPQRVARACVHRQQQRLGSCR